MIKHTLTITYILIITNIVFGQDTLTADKVIMMSEDTFFYPVSRNDSTKFTGVIVFSENEFKTTYSTYKKGVLIKSETKDNLNINSNYKKTSRDSLLNEEIEYSEKDELGNIIVLGYYKMDKKDGLWKYYKDNEIREQGFFDNGQKVGIWESYENNNLQEVKYFVNGNLVFLEMIKVKKGKLYTGEINFIDNDKIITFVYSEGILNIIRHIEKGMVVQEQGYLGHTNKTGKYFSKDNNGNLLITGEYLEGYRNGLWSFYKNGVKVKLGSYYFKGLKSGIWKYFSDKGVLERIEFYKHGELTSVEYYKD